MNGVHQVSPGVRQVLTAPRGHRFTRTTTQVGTRTGRTSPATLEEFFGQTAENPCVRNRREHSDPPPWTALHAARTAERDRHNPAYPRQPAPEPARPPVHRVPRPRPAPDDGPPKPPPRPPLPRRPRSHRKPRSRIAWRLVTYVFATTAGALAHHLVTTLM